MTPTACPTRSRSLSALCLVAGSVSLLLSGCGGGSGNNGGGGGGGGTTSYTITVQSSNPASGVAISYGNSVTSLSATGMTTFTLSESSGTTMIFGAPATAGGNNFGSWSGCTSVSGANCTVTVSGNLAITANYVTPIAPTVTLTPSASTITTAQALSVTVNVAPSQGGATPTGSVVLTSGSYTSAATPLSNGSVTINVPAGSLATGTDLLKATYTPDSASSTVYATSSGTASVTVNALPAPTMSLVLSSSSIGTAQPLTATITVSGTPTPTGSVVLSGGSYTSSTTALNTGVAVITVPAGSLAAGSDTLTATYTPDSASSSTYSSATTTASVIVGAITVSPASGNVTLGQSQQFSATATGLSPTTVTWSVAVASGSGSAGTISPSGLYQTPYPAPTSVTITATSTANTSIKGTSTVMLVAPATAAGPLVSIDAGRVTHPISPLIYGANAYLLDPTTVQNTNIPLARWGGDDTSRYNYQTNVVNSANDYYFENFTGANSMLPNGNNGNGTNFNDFMISANTLGISTIATAPVNGWVSNATVNACSFTKSAYPNQQSYDPSGNCGNGVQSNGTSLVGNNTIAMITSNVAPPPAAPGVGGNTPGWANSTWTGEWITCLLSKGTFCAGPGNDATIWDLDNEPEYWSAVHRDVHPNPMTYDEITNGGIGTALAIKASDGNALVSGPVISGWYQYFYSQQDVNAGYGKGPCFQPWENPTDRQNHSGTPLIEYYIQQMSNASDTYSVRLLDYVTIHAYYAAMYNGASVAFTTAGDTGEQQARMNSTRSFWDSTYTDPNNTGLYQPVYPPDPNQTTASCKTPASPNLIPMMQQWAANDWTSTKFPQRLKTAIDEYNFGGTESINGAVTQADTLGIFGKYGLDMGVFWPTSTYASQTPLNMAFAIYRNYDGNKSMFGDQELNSTTGDQSKLAVYAASRTADGAVTIVVINKTYGSLSDTLSINNLASTAAAAHVYQYSNANLNAIVAQPDVTITLPGSGGTTSTVTATFPGQSITLIVIPSH